MEFDQTGKDQKLCLTPSRDGIPSLKSLGGDGGNITIEAGFIIAPPNENSDITADAFGGTGGNIEITTQRNLGIEPREQTTDQSDITASSELGLDGTITLNAAFQGEILEPEVLSNELLDPSNQLIAGCLLDEDANFVITGRGGIPANTSEVLNQGLVWQDERREGAREIRAESATAEAATSIATHSPLRHTQKPEAQTWKLNTQGQIELLTGMEQPLLTPVNSPCDYL